MSRRAPQPARGEPTELPGEATAIVVMPPSRPSVPGMRLSQPEIEPPRRSRASLIVLGLGLVLMAAVLGAWGLVLYLSQGNVTITSPLPALDPHARTLAGETAQVSAQPPASPTPARVQTPAPSEALATPPTQAPAPPPVNATTPAPPPHAEAPSGGLTGPTPPPLEPLLPPEPLPSPSLGSATTTAPTTRAETQAPRVLRRHGRIIRRRAPQPASRAAPRSGSQLVRRPDF